MSNGVDRQDDDKTWYQYITSFEPTFEVEVAFVKAIVDADCEPADLEPMVVSRGNALCVGQFDDSWFS